MFSTMTVYHLHTHQQYLSVSFLHNLAVLVTFCLFYNNHYKWSEVIPPCDLDLDFLDDEPLYALVSSSVK